MRIKIYLSLLLFFFVWISLDAQNQYYYYKGQKIDLTINRSYINVIVNKELLKSSAVLQLFQQFNLEQNNYEQMQNGIIKLKFKSAPDIQEYSKVVKSLKQNESVKYAFPFFESGKAEPIGSSDIFYLKMKGIGDTMLIKKIAEQQNVQIIKQVPYMPLWYILSVQNSAFSNSVVASNYFYETGLFADVDPAFMFDFRVNCVNDPHFSSLWGLHNIYYSGIDINACDAWNYTKGAGINVAVVDKGIDSNHNDLKANLHSLSFDANSGTSPSVFTGELHGTHVAGTVAAIGNNNLQVVGVAPESKIMRVSHALLPSNTGSAELASGISWAWQNGADVINNSWGDQGGANYDLLHSSVLENSIINALTQGRNGKGCVVVFASGNWGLSNRLDYPGSFHNDILTVGSINWDGIRYSTSNYGDRLDVVAPGASIFSTISDNEVGPNSGTSMAAPHVSGIAALILSVNPDLTAKQVRDIIEQTAQKVGGYTYANSTAHPNGKWNNEMGYGLVNAYEAVKRAACMANPVNYIYLTGTQPPPSQTYKSVICNEITIQNATVPAGSTLILNACNKVTINPGFKVEAGAHFIVR